MKELFVSPHLLLFREKGKSSMIPLEDQVDICVRSLSEKEKKFFREERLFNFLQDQGIIKQGSYSWNGEEEAKELGFYMILNNEREMLRAVPYAQIATPYQRVVQLESKIADEVKRDEYVCDLRREVAVLRMGGVYLELYSIPDMKNLYDGVRIFLSEEYDVKANVRVGERVVN